jgi:hypothetical protein
MYGGYEQGTSQGKKTGAPVKKNDRTRREKSWRISENLQKMGENLGKWDGHCEKTRGIGGKLGILMTWNIRLFCRFSVIFPSCPHDFLHSFLRNLLRIFWEWDGLGGKTREIDGNIDDRKFELGLYGMLWECMGVYGILWDLLWFIGIYWDFMGFYFCKLTSDFCLLRISLQDIARLSMHKKYDIA